MALALYHQIAHALAQEIAQQSDQSVGLPTELALCERFGVSRYTVRAALQELAREGLITRKKRAGIRIAAPPPHGAFRENLGSLDDLVRLAATHAREVLRHRNVALDTAQANALGLPPGSQWLEISTRRIDSALKQRSSDQPICISTVWIDSQYASLLSEIREQQSQLISSLIEKRFGRRIAHVNQRVSAVQLNAAQAHALNSVQGSPALEVERQYFDRAGIAFEVARSVHPADRFSLTMRLDRTS